MTDACKTLPPYRDHLSLAEVWEFDRLERMGIRNHRWDELLARRIDPDRGHNKDDAA